MEREIKRRKEEREDVRRKTSAARRAAGASGAFGSRHEVGPGLAELRTTAVWMAVPLLLATRQRTGAADGGSVGALSWAVQGSGGACRRLQAASGAQSAQREEAITRASAGGHASVKHANTRFKQHY